MFTGIVQAVGTVRRTSRHSHHRRVLIETGTMDCTELREGDSLAVDGCCLTVAKLVPGGVETDLSEETLSRTTLGSLNTGDRVNLEQALTLSTPLGGHLVSGHVDGVTELLRRHRSGRTERWRLHCPTRLCRYIAVKGSICVAGISLTINSIAGTEFEVTLIPHTLEMTNLSDRRPGDRMNLEVDLIARYLERLMLGKEAANPDPGEGITRSFLTRNGFSRPERGGGNETEAKGTT